jgi:hypothetical protein
MLPSPGNQPYHIASTITAIITSKPLIPSLTDETTALKIAKVT